MNHKKMAMINYIRWSDVFRYENRFEEALSLLEKAKGILINNNFTDYEDIYFQHKGKIHFDCQDFAVANLNFEKVLEIRLKKKNLELIKSTHFAIEMNLRKLQMNIQSRMP